MELGIRFRPRLVSIHLVSACKSIGTITTSSEQHGAVGQERHAGKCDNIHPTEEQSGAHTLSIQLPIAYLGGRDVSWLGGYHPTFDQ